MVECLTFSVKFSRDLTKKKLIKVLVCVVFDDIYVYREYLVTGYCLSFQKKRKQKQKWSNEFSY